MSIIDNGNVYGYRTTGAVSFVDQDRIGRIVNILGKRDLRMLLPLFEADAADADAVQDIGQRSNHFIKRITSDFDPVLKGSVLAYRLNGVDEAFYMPDDDQFSMGADGTAPNEPAFSLGIAVKFNDATSNALITRVDFTAAAEEIEYFWEINNADRMNIQIYDETSANYIGQTAVAGAALTENRWYVLVMTYDGSAASSGITLYVNGAAISSAANAGGVYVAMHNMSVATAVGYFENAAGNLTSFLDGNVALPFITARELSAADVLELTNIYREVLRL